MNIAIIDCGTNTFHLMIVATRAHHQFEVVFKKNVAVKLGEDGITSKVISTNPFSRGMSALRFFKKEIEKHHVKKTVAFATAAIRNAKNGQEFIKQAKTETGIEIQTIDGLKEAELIYLGVRRAVSFGTDKYLVMDIGGGSVEFIIANKTKIFWHHSYEIGAALLLEKFKPSNPITKDEIKTIEKYLDKELTELIKQFKAAKIKQPVLVGSAGSFETFAEMIAHQFFTPEILDRKIEFEIDLKLYKTIHKQLVESTLDQRKKMKGIITMRLDMIVIASILTNYILSKLGIEKLVLSTYSLKDGMLYFAMDVKTKS